MKKFTVLLVSLFYAATLCAQSGIFETRTVKSSVLSSERKYAVYLPQGYESSDRSYPVLYLLHGLGDNHTGWVQFGQVQHIADNAIAEGRACEMIIVMPDANTVMPGYFNAIDGKHDYEDFFFKEFMPYIEKTYRIRSEKRYRAIAGLSMGGGGTLYYALHNPDLFAAACPLSGWFGQPTLEMFIKSAGQNSLNPILSGLSDETIKKYFTLHNADAYLASLSEENIRAVRQLRWYISCGDDDFLIESNNLLYNTFRAFKVPAEYRVKDGAHTWGYWRNELPIVLEFVSKSFMQQ